MGFRSALALLKQELVAMVLLLVVAELDFLVLSLSERLTGCNFYLLIIIGSFFFGWSSAIQSNGLCPNGED